MNMKANHQVNVVRIAEILPHANADSLGLVMVGGYQVVVKLTDFRVGDLGVYIQPDSVVPADPEFAFLWDGRGFTDYVPEKYRRITVRKFRKEWSEGLLLPLATFYSEEERLGLNIQQGDDISEDLGITHYEPPEPAESTQAVNQRRIRPKPLFKGGNLKAWFYFILEWLGFRPNGNTGGRNDYGPKLGRPVYDVEALKNHMGVFEEGEEVVVTEKIHGSNARYTFQDGTMYVGSRTLWKSETAQCVWRSAVQQCPGIEAWCREHPRHTLYGEVVPTQGDKYLYGCSPGQVKFFLFDIMDPEGEWLPIEAVINVNQYLEMHNVAE
jgi:hypothetical protein